jgi:two-component system LytT family sensor kinase
VSITAILSGNFGALLNYLFFYSVNISLFYVHALVVLNFGLGKGIKSIWKLPCFLTLELVIYLSINIGGTTLLDGQTAFKDLVTVKFIVAALWRAVYFMLHSSGYYFLTRYLIRETFIFEEAIKTEQLKNQLLTTQNDFLRAQINPHLLFNTLNFIRYASKKRPQAVDEAIMALSEIMNFSLDRSHSENVPLKNELNQIENLIRLNELRYDGDLRLNFSVDADNDQIKIIPIVLITLVENIFKHGNLLNDNHPAILKIGVKEGLLTYLSSNLVGSGHITTEQESGTGLRNIKSRLNAYYPEKHEFSYGLNKNVFDVNLKIQLT